MVSSLAGLSLRDLEYLEAVAEHRHFGRAAETCGVSQPALSIQIRKLEALLDTAIFERTPRGALLTPDGERVLSLSRIVLREARALLARPGRQDDEPAGPLRLGALPTLGPYLLPQIIRPLRGRFPKLRLMLSEDHSGALIDRLTGGELDAVLICRTEDGTSLRHLDLFFEPFVVVRPADGHDGPVAPDAGDTARMMVIEEGHCLHDQLRATCGTALRGATRRAPSLEMLRQMVAAGEGVSLMPILAALSFERGDGLTAHHTLDDPSAGREIVLSHRRSDPRERCFRVIAAAIRDALAKQPVRLMGPDAAENRRRQGSSAECPFRT